MLKIEHAFKTFNITNNKDDERIALDDLSLNIEDGEFVTIIGGNGSGKSTLMNAISGVVALDSGTIEIKGKNLTHIEEYKRAKYLGRVFQDPNVGTAPRMSIIENLMLSYRRDKNKTLRWGFDKSLREEFIKKLSDLNLGLEERIDQKVELLSGGQRQAVTLIMATLSRPDLLLLDEHTAALDPRTAKSVLAMTKKIVEENKITTLMITHNMKDAIDYGNRLIMMKDGKIILNISGEEKKKLSKEDLIKKFDTIDDTQLVL